MLKPAEFPERPTLKRAIFQAAMLALLMVLSLSLYLAVLKWRGPAVVWVTRTEWDRLVPFQPIWVWAYLIPYLVGPVVVGLLSRSTFAWYIRRGLLVVLASVILFAVWPTQTLRPAAEDLGDGITAALYRNMVTIDDPPANAAPSMHVSLTCLLAWTLLRDFPRWWPITLIGVGVVWLATLLTHQHHLVDVASGVALGSLLALPYRRMRLQTPGNAGGQGALEAHSSSES